MLTYLSGKGVQTGWDNVILSSVEIYRMGREKKKTLNVFKTRSFLKSLPGSLITL